jgi:hypothetical protein
VTPGRFFTHYFNSSERVRTYASERGVPASPGTTTLELDGTVLTATTAVDGVPIIRTTAEIGGENLIAVSGHLRYITEVKHRLISGLYPCGDGAAHHPSHCEQPVHITGRFAGHADGSR